jgi:MFS family permease
MTLGQEAAGGLSRYRNFLGRPGVLRLQGSALLARLPGGMNALVLVLVIQQRSSLAAAGAAAAAYTAGTALIGPLRGRAADRRGAGQVLVVSGTAQAACMLGLFGAVVTSAPVVVEIALAGVIGAVLPPVNPVMRTIWSRTLDGAARRIAFSIESVMIDVIFIVGPALVAVVTALSGARWCLILTAVLTGCGCLALAAAPESRGWPGTTEERHWLGAWRDRRLRRLLPIGFFATGSISAIELAIVAFSRVHGHPALSGYLIASLSVGSIVGGLAFGALNFRAGPLRQLAVTAAALGMGYAVGSLAGSVVVLGVMLACTGLFLAPTITLEYTAVDDVADPGAKTESFALLNAMGQAGSATGSVLAGFAGQHGHGQGGFLVAAAMALAAGCLSLAVGIWTPRSAARGKPMPGAHPVVAGQPESGKEKGS